jgi:hypothetical protein
MLCHGTAAPDIAKGAASSTLGVDRAGDDQLATMHRVLANHLCRRDDEPLCHLAVGHAEHLDQQGIHLLRPVQHCRDDHLGSYHTLGTAGGSSARPRRERASLPLVHVRSPRDRRVWSLPRVRNALPRPLALEAVEPDLSAELDSSTRGTGRVLRRDQLTEAARWPGVNGVVSCGKVTRHPARGTALSQSNAVTTGIRKGAGSSFLQRALPVFMWASEVNLPPYCVGW